MRALLQGYGRRGRDGSARCARVASIAALVVALGSSGCREGAFPTLERGDAWNPSSGHRPATGTASFDRQELRERLQGHWKARRGGELLFELDVAGERARLRDLREGRDTVHEGALVLRSATSFGIEEADGTVYYDSFVRVGEKVHIGPWSAIRMRGPPSGFRAELGAWETLVYDGSSCRLVETWGGERSERDVPCGFRGGGDEGDAESGGRRVFHYRAEDPFHTDRLKTFELIVAGDYLLDPKLAAVRAERTGPARGIAPPSTGGGPDGSSGEPAEPGRHGAGSEAGEESALNEALRRHVDTLAGAIGERHVDRERSYRRAASYVERTWKAQGHEVEVTSYETNGVTCRMLQATLEGRRRPDEVVVLGAHYDTVPGSPGADDNASGVAALLEIGRALRGAHPARTLHLVAFPNEEAPHFGTPAQGARRYARRAKRRGRRIRGMLSLESLGYYTDEPGSQSYPPLVGWLYPRRGDFVAVVGNLPSFGLTGRVARSLRRGQTVPVEWLAAPEAIEAIGRSDHAAFWDHGFPAAMVTDTAPFRNPHYHEGSDTPETLDYERLASVTRGLVAVAKDLAGISTQTREP